MGTLVLAERIIFTEMTRRVYDLTIEQAYRNRCPCCGGPLGVGETDHWFGRHRGRINEGWVVCRECHERLHGDGVFRATSEPCFHAFQIVMAFGGYIDDPSLSRYGRSRRRNGCANQIGLFPE